MPERTTLQTSRLLLRPFEIKDVDDVYSYASEPDWARYLPVPQPYLREHVVEFVARKLIEDKSKCSTFAVVYDGKCVGAVELGFDPARNIGEVGYSLAKDLWGKGLVTEAVKAVTDWGFGTLGLAKVHARADVRNLGSLRVMIKSGMSLEGCLRSHDVVRGERIDVYCYAILREDWKKARGGR
ncbi:MAG: GNAT family N-acetyltransferase [SAR202 cluster bacterium]|nr:GNAT family N-acetyltransferase [SAR202 cluster bacterium]